MAKLRSLLKITSLAENAMAKALASGADALMFDLSDEQIDRLEKFDWLEQYLPLTAHALPQIFVSVSMLGGTGDLKKISQIISANPSGILLTGIFSTADIEHLDALISVAEAEYGRQEGYCKIIAIPAGSVEGLTVPLSRPLPREKSREESKEDSGEESREKSRQEAANRQTNHSEDHAAKLPRLCAVAWDANAVARAIGCKEGGKESGEEGGDDTWPDPCRYVRSRLLFTARSLNVRALDTAYGRSSDPDRLRRAVDKAARDGFAGKFAVDPAHISIINAGFSS